METKHNSNHTSSWMQQSRWHSIFRLLSLDNLLPYWQKIGLNFQSQDCNIIHMEAKDAHLRMMGDVNNFYYIDYTPTSIEYVVQTFFNKLKGRLQSSVIDELRDWGVSYFEESSNDTNEWLWVQCLFELTNLYAQGLAFVELPEERKKQLILTLESVLKEQETQKNDLIRSLQKPVTDWDKQVFSQSGGVPYGPIQDAELLMTITNFYHWWNHVLTKKFSKEEIESLYNWCKKKSGDLFPLAKNVPLRFPTKKI